MRVFIQPVVEPSDEKQNRQRADNRKGAILQYRSNRIGNRGDNYKFDIGDGIAARKLGDTFRRAVKKDERAQAQAHPDAKKPLAAR